MLEKQHEHTNDDEHTDLVQLRRMTGNAPVANAMFGQVGKYHAEDAVGRPTVTAPGQKASQPPEYMKDDHGLGQYVIPFKGAELCFFAKQQKQKKRQLTRAYFWEWPHFLPDQSDLLKIK